jgi:hypothetical protein
MLRWLLEKSRKLRDFSRQVEAARLHYSVSRTAAFSRAFLLLLKQFSPKEILLWGLLDPNIDGEGLKAFVSKERFSKFQSTISPSSYACLLEDKEVFYRFCEAIDFPIPATIAFLSDKCAWFPGGQLASVELTLQARLNTLHGAELILKPCDGVYGRDIRALMVDSGYVVEKGRRFSATELMHELAPDTRYILQRRLANHDAIRELAGLNTLQALRVVTVLPPSPGERGRVMSACLRLSANEDIVNNFDYGRGGNVRAKIDVSSGIIIRSVRASPSGFGMEEVERVARTDVALIGFEIPFWRETRDLLETKSASFYPIRMVGWDIAITPSGPIVIEGNFWFDPAINAYAEAGDFVGQVTR